VRSQVLTAANIDGCLLGDEPDDGGSKYLWNVGKLL
jgi:hypothetical protein